jgi:hypothetical protein
MQPMAARLGAGARAARRARPAAQIVLAVILGACPLCCQAVTLDRLAAALAGT